MNIRQLFFIFLLWFPAVAVHAALPDNQLFIQGSMKEVAVAHTGKPFILAFWSLSCAHCKANLEQFGKLLQEYPQLPLVLVSTDTPEEQAAIMTVLEKYGLGRAQNWVFADRFVERLYFEIDRRWRGELPRTYLYDANHKALIITGKLDETEIAQWVKTHY